MGINPVGGPGYQGGEASQTPTLQEVQKFLTNLAEQPVHEINVAQFEMAMFGIDSIKGALSPSKQGEIQPQLEKLQNNFENYQADVKNFQLNGIMSSTQSMETLSSLRNAMHTQVQNIAHILS